MKERRNRRDADKSEPYYLAGRPASPIMRRDPHPIAAIGRAAPSSRVILGRVVEEGSASGIRTLLDEREVSVTEQIAR